MIYCAEPWFAISVLVTFEILRAWIIQLYMFWRSQFEELNLSFNMSPVVRFQDKQNFRYDARKESRQKYSNLASFSDPTTSIGRFWVLAGSFPLGKRPQRCP